MTLRAVPSVTKTESALRTLREAIQNGRLRPGTRLTLQELAAGLGMSYTPVREALRQLQTEGLVDYRPHFGTVVADYSRERAEEVYLLRRVLEPLAAALAAERASPSDLDDIDDSLAALTAAVRDRRAQDVPALNAELHRRVYAASGSVLLTEFIDRLWNGVPYQAISLTDRVEDSHHDHEAIVAALRRRDPETAAEALRRHIDDGAEAALAALDAMFAGRDPDRQPHPAGTGLDR